MATPRDALAVNDTVQIGKGQTKWVVVGFGRWHTGDEYAELKSVEGYSNTTALVDRLTVIGGDR